MTFRRVVLIGLSLIRHVKLADATNLLAVRDECANGARSAEIRSVQSAARRSPQKTTQLERIVVRLENQVGELSTLIDRVAKTGFAPDRSPAVELGIALICEAVATMKLDRPIGREG